MAYFWVLAIAAAAVAAYAGLAYIAHRTRLKSAARLQATRDFATARGELEAKFLQAAASTGKPRGLRWVACQLGEQPLFVIEAATGDLVALTPTTVSFEAVEGGGMEDVEAVANLRGATAVFVHRDGIWTTEGRVLFNLDPSEALARFGETLQPIPVANPAS